jgi:hypothetical protein
MLPDSVVSTLRASETAALAAAMIIVGSFPDIASFAARVAGAPPDAPEPQRAVKRSNGHGGRARREAPDQCDERLVEAMKANPMTIGALAAATGKSRTSTVSALHRLRDVGLAESLSGVWTLIGPPASKETARWVEPVVASRGAREV